MENTKKTVAAIGKFDGFHVGHMKLLNTAIKTAKQTDGKSLIFFIGRFAGLNHSCKAANEYALKIGFDEYFRQDLSRDFMNLDADTFVNDGNYTLKETVTDHIKFLAENGMVKL